MSHSARSAAFRQTNSAQRTSSILTPSSSASSTRMKSANPSRFPRRWRSAGLLRKNSENGVGGRKRMANLICSQRMTKFRKILRNLPARKRERSPLSVPAIFGRRQSEVSQLRRNSFELVALRKWKFADFLNCAVKRRIVSRLCRAHDCASPVPRASHRSASNASAKRSISSAASSASCKTPFVRGSS